MRSSIGLHTLRFYWGVCLSRLAYEEEEVVLMLILATMRLWRTLLTREAAKSLRVPALTKSLRVSLVVGPSHLSVLLGKY